MKNTNNYDLQVDIAKDIFLQYDQIALIQKFQLQADDLHIYLPYLGVPHRISRKTGDVEQHLEGGWSACRTYSTVMTIYDLLCFHRGEDTPALAGQWCRSSAFVVTGGLDTGTYTNQYALLFHCRIPELKEACKVLGGTLLPSMAGADVTCRFDATPFLPVLLQFWEGDEDFPPRLILMWDANADQYLRYETTFYLQGDLLERLKGCMEMR